MFAVMYINLYPNIPEDSKLKAHQIVGIFMLIYVKKHWVVPACFLGCNTGVNIYHRYFI